MDPRGHQDRRDDETDRGFYPPPGTNYGTAPPYSGQPYPPYPPTNPIESHGSEYGGVTHISHHHSQGPHVSPFYPNPLDGNRLPGNIAGFAGKPTVKVYSKANPNYYLTVRDGKVTVALFDSINQAQHWYKDDKYSTRVRDAEGHPGFALVNKATGLALKHAKGPTQTVELTPYNPDRLDESVIWAESKEMGAGYRTIRMVNNIRLNMDAYLGEQGAIREGTSIVLWDWNNGDNQLWKIAHF